MKHILFNVQHLNIIDIAEEYKQGVLALENTRFVLSNLPGGPAGDAVTVMLDGRILTCMGYWSALPGVAEVWLFPSIYVKENPIIFVREVRRYLEALADTFKWHRIQTITKVTDEHRKWMKALGFVEEGVMKQYYDRQDFIMSARYFEGS